MQQPVLNRRLHGGDLQISSAILTSGNNFAKCALFAKFLKLYFPSTSKFTAIQRKYLVPTISTFWKEQQRDIIENLQGESIIALGLFISIKFTCIFFKVLHIYMYRVYSEI